MRRFLYHNFQGSNRSDLLCFLITYSGCEVPPWMEWEFFGAPCVTEIHATYPASVYTDNTDGTKVDSGRFASPTTRSLQFTVCIAPRCASWRAHLWRWSHTCAPFHKCSGKDKWGCGRSRYLCTKPCLMIWMMNFRVHVLLPGFWWNAADPSWNCACQHKLGTPQSTGGVPQFPHGNDKLHCHFSTSMYALAAWYTYVSQDIWYVHASPSSEQGLSGSSQWDRTHGDAWKAALVPY